MNLGTNYYTSVHKYVTSNYEKLVRNLQQPINVTFQKNELTHYERTNTPNNTSYKKININS
jgi:hypothetical protein